MKNKIILATGHKHAFHRVSGLAAIENGYFREEGLPEVELIASGEDRLTVEGLKSGSIDFGLDVKPGLILEAGSKGDGLYIIGGMLNQFPSTFIGTPDLKSVADLKGKKIGIKEEGGSREVVWIRMLLRKAGMDPDKDVTWVTHAGYGSLEIQKPRLEKGDYQAVGLSAHYKRPELFDLVRKAGLVVLAERSETHPSGLPDRAVATTGSTISEYPKETIKVLKAVIRGYRFSRDKKNTERIKKMYLTYDWGKDGFGWGKFDPALLDGMIASAQYLPSDGSFNARGMEDLIKEYKAWGKIPKNFTLERVTRLEYAQQAAKELDKKFGVGRY
ncbi:MAG: ABC transporter substrate-binding protein [Thermodesulfobacteriota bacterium]